MAANRRHDSGRQLAPSRGLEGLCHTRMPPKKLYLYVILVLDIGQNAACKCVAAARFQSEYAASKIRAVFPRPRHTGYYLPIHQVNFSLHWLQISRFVRLSVGFDVESDDSQIGRAHV